MSKSVGLEIHARGVRAVEVTGKGKSFRILRYIERAVTPRGGQPDPEELADALDEVFKGAKFSKNSVVASLPADETVVREIPVPFKSDDQIRKVIKYEAEHHLHDCDADDVVVQYTHIGESADGANLLVFAARKTDISRRIEYCRGSGVEPLTMDLDATAFFQAVRAAGMLDETPSVVLLKIGHKSTDMVFVHDGELRALRSVRMGVDSIVSGLARDMDIEFAEADTKLAGMTGGRDTLDLLIPEADPDEKRETEKSHAELERDLFQTKRDDFLARLRREYVRSSAAVRGTRPTKIIATGAGLRINGLLDMLSNRLGIDVEPFQPSRAFPCKLNGTPAEEFDAHAAVCIGLSIKGQGDDPLGIDFRQEELKVANKFELLKTTLAVSVTLAFLSLMAASFFFVYKRTSLMSERFNNLELKAYQNFETVTREYNKLSNDIVSDRDKVQANAVAAGDPPRAIKRYVNRLRRMKSKLTRFMGNEEGIQPIISALLRWNEIFGAIHKMHEELGYIDFERIEIKQVQVSISVIVPSVAAVEALKDPISKLPSMEGMVFDEKYSIQPVGGTDRQAATLKWDLPKKKRRRRGR